RGITADGKRVAITLREWPHRKQIGRRHDLVNPEPLHRAIVTLRRTHSNVAVVMRALHMAEATTRNVPCRSADRPCVCDPRWPFAGRAISVTVCGGVSKRVVVIAR
ncbi:MAG: hypothetical protein ACRDMZ_14425, partial [Solirubrobacteraceae bacterium]